MDGILRKTAAYVEVAQTEIDTNNVKRAEFLKRAGVTAEKLAAKGIIPADRVSTFVSKIAENESEIWAFVERLADAVSTGDMGSKTVEKLAAEGTKLDPFERLVLFGSSQADAKSNLMLE